MPDCIAQVLKEMQNDILKKRKLKNRGKKGKGKRKSSPSKVKKWFVFFNLINITFNEKLNYTYVKLAVKVLSYIFDLWWN